MSPPLPSRSWLIALVSLCTALLFWAVLPLLLEHFTHLLDPWTVNGARYFFSAGFWAPFVVRELRRLSAAERSALWRAAAGPAAAHCVCQAFFGFAPYYNNATMLNFGCRMSIPFTTLFGFWLVKSERPLARSRRFWLGLGVALVGFLLLFEKGLGTDETSGTGILLLLGFAVSWGLYVVLVRRNLSGVAPHLSYGMVSLLSLPPLLVALFALGDWTALLHLPMAQWGWLVVSALIGLALSHVLFYRAILLLGPIAAEGSLLLLPFLTAVLAHVWLGEHLSRLQWIGGAGLVTGCAMLLWARVGLLTATGIEDPAATRPSHRVHGGNTEKEGGIFSHRDSQRRNEKGAPPPE